jgi:hypothetical protein
MDQNMMEKKLQELMDLHEIQNVMSMHQYYHAANMHREELDTIWAQKTPGVSWESGGGRYEGMDMMRKWYVEAYGQMAGKKQLEEMRKLFPDKIADSPENEYIGYSVQHTLTTPVIEVAGDGKTAKGVWVSPGYLTLLENGKLRAYWYWDKYGVDFVKEDGKWKIWHVLVCMSFRTPYERSWAEQESAPKNPVDSGFPKRNGVKRTDFHSYSPFTVSQYLPRPPVPYRTFEETFSY